MTDVEWPDPDQPGLDGVLELDDPARCFEIRAKSSDKWWLYKYGWFRNCPVTFFRDAPSYEDWHSCSDEADHIEWRKRVVQEQLLTASDVGEVEAWIARHDDHFDVEVVRHDRILYNSDYGPYLADEWFRDFPESSELRSLVDEHRAAMPFRCLIYVEEGEECDGPPGWEEDYAQHIVDHLTRALDDDSLSPEVRNAYALTVRDAEEFLRKRASE